MTALLNKTALVTGGSRGIGRATASALAAAGAHVLVHYGRSAQEAESLVADIRSKEGTADAIQADLGNARRRDTTRDGGALNCWRATGCACVQRRHFQGCNHPGSYGRRL